MSNNKYNDAISNTKIKQIALIIVIVTLFLLMAYQLAMFIPSLLGAITLYVISRKYNLYLIEKRNWKPWISALVIMLATVVILILPLYFLIDTLIEKLGNAQAYMDKFNDFLDKIHSYILSEVQIDILSKENLDKVKETAGQLSTFILSSTLNTVTIIASTYFLLYFMLVKPRVFERILTNAAPLKKTNVNLISEKIRKMIIANAIGIPVVAFGQGLAALVGYLIFGAPSVMLLFTLTTIASMIPIVGGAIIYVPVAIFMVAEGNTIPGIGLAIYCLVVVGLIDNVLRFTLLKKLEDIHPLNTVFGIILGMNLFGFMGLVFGPILVSVTLLLIQIYRDEFSDEDNVVIASDEEALAGIATTEDVEENNINSTTNEP
ncbi:AI-2E family transporter [Riemerella anatipestifer]|uniref:AI-2E family transporter n=1 Tax=Riemerella anatipestifer TaxID=34085 RepID=UPI00129DDECE|nr:AI-2E family transporter [Riemerella anatipestifer]MBT0551707.1 AI-2E family transporter [Riemerella anatipestifer]MBT0553173.1 AI-2E family transporter [Riemerella anatipestifer]MCE3023868.1 AI-2E family transporter [Riemerella anatipestifer]MCU7541694.1 AI-2E family transporter [Riemerella anatipestifer]MCU7559479.1 AI-2E family transporter [Riemerella anatipestifer]